ncbi:MAG TPA: hypothetical protein VHK70_10960, partial [Burkholderiaceae bacterium]|nr:hypothetical protein [Burkholderiaceae bacterium]
HNALSKSGGQRNYGRSRYARGWRYNRSQACPYAYCVNEVTAHAQATLEFPIGCRTGEVDTFYPEVSGKKAISIMPGAGIPSLPIASIDLARS